MWDFLVQQVINQIAKYFDTFAIFCGAIIVATGFFITQILARFFKEPNTTWKWIITYIISIAASLIGYIFNLGIFEPLNIVQAFIVAVGTGLVAGGLYEIPFVQAILEKLGIRISKDMRDKLNKDKIG